MQEGRRINYAEKGERLAGDRLTYFILHNIVSGLIFFLVTIFMDVYVEKDYLLGYTWLQILVYLISREFWMLTITQIFPIMLISSVTGRIVTFYAIRWYVRYADRKTKVRRTTKRWSELNKGVNRMGIRFILTALIASFIYSIGVVVLLSNMIFEETAFLPLLIIYFCLKLGTYFFVRYIIGKKT